jgi:hypothetical protein
MKRGEWYAANVKFGADWSGDDIKAIQRYFADTPAKTPKAVSIKDEFIKWHDGLWFYSEADWDKARNYRNEYNLANATTAVEKAAVQTVLKTGQSAEQLQGRVDRRLSTGMLPGGTAGTGLHNSWNIAALTVGALGLLGGAGVAFGFGKLILGAKVAGAGVVLGGLTYGVGKVVGVGAQIASAVSGEDEFAPASSPARRRVRVAPVDLINGDPNMAADAEINGPHFVGRRRAAPHFVGHKKTSPPMHFARAPRVPVVPPPETPPPTTATPAAAPPPPAPEPEAPEQGGGGGGGGGSSEPQGQSEAQQEEARQEQQNQPPQEQPQQPQQPPQEQQDSGDDEEDTIEGDPNEQAIHPRWAY